MSKQEFREILDRVRAGEQTDLVRTVDGARYVRRFEPAERLILLGGGHVALALAGIAAMLGFAVTVIDDRPEFANTERFPMAVEVICDGFAHAISELGLRPADYVCTLTRGHRWDEVCMRAIRETGAVPRYLGMLGSKQRAAGMKRQLAEEGFPAEFLERLRSPVGLPIGALTAEEIAVSISAELIQERRKDGKRAKEGCLVQTGVNEAVLSLLADPAQPCALLLVLDTSGETPLKSGAFMAVDRLGRAHGTIGGGCAEAAAMLRAKKCIGTGAQSLLTVDLTADMPEEEARVCGGTMTVLIEDVN